MSDSNIRVVNFRDAHEYSDDHIFINTTSRSNVWSRGLSPFIISGGHLYGNYYAKNVENAWQFAKVYASMVDVNQNPNKSYFNWAEKGWNDNRAHRYPMGRFAFPLYSYWNGEKLSYTEARKKIYIPIYGRQVIKTQAYKKLYDISKNSDRIIALLDFDAYDMDKENVDRETVINNPERKMGHAFVLKFLLDDNVNPEENYI